ncbi:hypothetical protein ACM1PE_07045 [Achromobacter sp. PD1]|uniref:hypothetical protein n=1 Tax=Achromobacter sp. PD1 TaxID=3399125 RepID=UPI003AF8811E
MKKILLALALIGFNAQAEDVYVFPGYDDVGNEMPKKEIIYTLYTSRPCPLPIANQKNLKLADIYNLQRPSKGCWGIALEPTKSQVVVIGEYGSIASDLNLTNFARAKINGSGAYIIQGPAMSPEQYRANVKRYQDSLR